MGNKQICISLVILAMTATNAYISGKVIGAANQRNYTEELSRLNFRSFNSLQVEKIDREGFFLKCLQHKEFIRLTKGNAKKRIEAFFDYWEQTDYTDKRWLAYILGTVYRETQATMMPIREGNCYTNECSIRAVGELVKKRNIENKLKGKPLMDDYSVPDDNGNSYYGRGFIQLTGKKNYKNIGNKIGVGDLLVDQPDSALSVKYSIKIAIEGSVEGWFTKNKHTKLPNKLSNFFNDTTEDWVLARNIINPGTSLAHKKITAELAKKFYQCLQ